MDGALCATTTKVESILILFANILDIASKYINYLLGDVLYLVHIKTGTVWPSA